MNGVSDIVYVILEYANSTQLIYSIVFTYSSMICTFYEFGHGPCIILSNIHFIIIITIIHNNKYKVGLIVRSR